MALNLRTELYHGFYGMKRETVQGSWIFKNRITQKENNKNVNAHMGIDRLLYRRMFGFCAVFVLGVSRLSVLLS